MPTLNFIGKEKVSTYNPPFHILEKKYNFGGETQNKIIHGDNLLALKSLLPEFEGKIKCVYIDPPYNTGNENWIYNDNVNAPQIKKWLGQVVGKEGEDLTRHDKWLCMMYPRLKLLKKLLSDDGAIFISIDDNEQANLKLICDEIFGSQNFIAQLVWQKRKGGGNDSTFIATDHEYIFIYCKNIFFQNKKWRVPYEGDYLKRYKFSDEIGKFYYDTLSRPGLNNPIIYDVTCPDGTVIKNGTWQISEKTFYEELANGNVDFVKNKNGGYTVVKKVRVPAEGKVQRSILNEVTNKNAADEMGNIFNDKKFFSTPKPVGLLEKILQLCTEKNSIILDSFAGSGTTAHAVLNLNQADGGERKFILVEMEDYAEKITAERVRRDGGSFDFYEIGETIFDDEGNLNENLDAEKIFEYIWFTETGKKFEKISSENKFYLGEFDGTGIYFNYEKNSRTYLDFDFLATIKIRAENYLIYADECLLSEEQLSKYKIIFKKIPRDIKKI